jgi:hypothetical protein
MRLLFSDVLRVALFVMPFRLRPEIREEGKEIVQRVTTSVFLASAC